MNKSISIIGTGNIACQLAKGFYNSGVLIDLIVGKSEEEAIQLAKSVKAMHSCDVSTYINSEILIISVSDDTYKDVVPLLNIASDTFVVHTSGSVSIDIFLSLQNEYGVFYPLQTFSKGRTVDLSSIPICIEASSPGAYKVLNEIATQLTYNVISIDSTQRQQLHLAAVFCCNYVNYMYTCSKELLNSQALSFDIFYPLILETAKKAVEMDPKLAQTGPAIRNDVGLIQRHIEMFERQDLKNIYTLLTEQIINKYNS
jgi:predicted short-subunit dehydrogenase-like oxidoreductase (DUF2520 family)